MPATLPPEEQIFRKSITAEERRALLEAIPDDTLKSLFFRACYEDSKIVDVIKLEILSRGSETEAELESIERTAEYEAERDRAYAKGGRSGLRQFERDRFPNDGSCGFGVRA